MLETVVQTMICTGVAVAYMMVKENVFSSEQEPKRSKTEKEPDWLLEENGHRAMGFSSPEQIYLSDPNSDRPMGFSHPTNTFK